MQLKFLCSAFIEREQRDDLRLKAIVDVFRPLLAIELDGEILSKPAPEVPPKTQWMPLGLLQVDPEKLKVVRDTAISQWMSRDQTNQPYLRYLDELEKLAYEQPSQLQEAEVQALKKPRKTVQEKKKEQLTAELAQFQAASPPEPTPEPEPESKPKHKQKKRRLIVKS